MLVQKLKKTLMTIIVKGIHCNHSSYSFGRELKEFFVVAFHQHSLALKLANFKGQLTFCSQLALCSCENHNLPASSTNMGAAALCMHVKKHLLLY